MRYSYNTFTQDSLPTLVASNKHIAALKSCSDLSDQLIAISGLSSQFILAPTESTPAHHVIDALCFAACECKNDTQKDLRVLAIAGLETCLTACLKERGVSPTEQKIIAHLEHIRDNDPYDFRDNSISPAAVAAASLLSLYQGTSSPQTPLKPQSFCSDSFRNVLNKQLCANIATYAP